MFTACRQTQNKSAKEVEQQVNKKKQREVKTKKVPWKCEIAEAKKRKKVLAFAITHFTMVCVATKRTQGERKARVTAKLYKALCRRQLPLTIANR